MMNKLFHFSNMAEEYVYMIAFSSAMEVLGVFQIAHGNICSSVISPREIILRILISGASGAVVLHNHPSGSVIPSANDLQVFRQLKNSFSLFNIDLHDFIIVGDSFYSFKMEEHY